MQKCVFLGYLEGYKGWRFYNPTTKKVIITERADFDERYMPLKLTPTPPPSTPSTFDFSAPNPVHSSCPDVHSGGDMSDVDPLNPLDLPFEPHSSMPAPSGHSRPSTPFSTPPSSPLSSPHLSPKRSPPPSLCLSTPPLAPERSSSPDKLQLHSGDVINPIDYTTPCSTCFAAPESPPSTPLAAPAPPPLPSALLSSSPATSDDCQGFTLLTLFQSTCRCKFSQNVQVPYLLGCTMVLLAYVHLYSLLVLLRLIYLLGLHTFLMTYKTTSRLLAY
jgi:hypothetical protein